MAFNTNGVILYRGFSPIDGAPIVLIATGLTAKSANSKTGDEIQTWILREDVNPVHALNEGLDESICGDCPHRKINQGSCYVNVGQAPNAVWKCHKTGKGYQDASESADWSAFFSGRVVRFGSYGDPAMVPVNVWRKILSSGVTNHTGYTHQWGQEFAQDLKGLVQASVDSFAQFIDADSKGWKCFIVKRVEDVIENAAHCAASKEKGQKTTCAACHLCDGSSTHVVINAHGKGAKHVTFAG